ncbi:hypothetical protein KIW84_043516 [Lathyrus oleraceus]|uniref:Uncharacterized protein n=1 Tax=Pisum sativum TaxID=3888 RepID=A0A9D5AU50_PEA|nr:hypothetical protein KIW84_043516 [Pisum sativum]
MDLRSCGACTKFLSDKSAWSNQKFVANSDFSFVVVLIGSHTFHAECLETMTAEADKDEGQEPQDVHPPNSEIFSSHHVQPPEDLLTGNPIDKFLDDPNLCEDKLSEEARSEGFFETITKTMFPDVGGLGQYNTTLLSTNKTDFDNPRILPAVKSALLDLHVRYASCTAMILMQLLSTPMEKETRSSTMVDKISPGSDVIAHESPSTLSMVLPSTSFMKVGEGPKADEKFEVSPISGPNNNAATIATTTVTGFGSDKPALPNGSISNPSLFNLENKIISSAEISTSVTSSKETAKSALVFGLEKAVPSKEGGPDAPPVNFDTNQNVFKVPPIPFTTSSIVGGESSLKFGASFDSQSGGSISFTTVAGSTGSMQKVRESDGGDAETNTNTGFSVRTAELAVSSAAPASLSTPPNSIFKFGQFKSK